MTVIKRELVQDRLDGIAVRSFLHKDFAVLKRDDLDWLISTVSHFEDIILDLTDKLDDYEDKP